MRGLGDDLDLLVFDEYMFYGAMVFEVTMPMTQMGAPIFFLSSQARSPDAIGLQIIERRDENGRRAVRLISVRPGIVGIDEDDDEVGGMHTSIGAQVKRDFLSHVPQSNPKVQAFAWWKPVTNVSLSKQIASEHVRKVARRRAIFLATLPGFQDPSSVKLLAKLMGEEAFNKEILNEKMTLKREAAFSPDALVQLQRGENGLYCGTEDHRRVIVTYDPSGGGRASDAAIMSCLMIQVRPERSTPFVDDRFMMVVRLFFFLQCSRPSHSRRIIGPLQDIGRVVKIYRGTYSLRHKVLHALLIAFQFIQVLHSIQLQVLQSKFLKFHGGRQDQ